MHIVLCYILIYSICLYTVYNKYLLLYYYTEREGAGRERDYWCPFGTVRFAHEIIFMINRRAMKAKNIPLPATRVVASLLPLVRVTRREISSTPHFPYAYDESISPRIFQNTEPSYFQNLEKFFRPKAEILKITDGLHRTLTRKNMCAFGWWGAREGGPSIISSRPSILLKHLSENKIPSST